VILAGPGKSDALPDPGAVFIPNLPGGDFQRLQRGDREIGKVGESFAGFLAQAL
jgi:hypothetical protein